MERQVKERKKERGEVNLVCIFGVWKVDVFVLYLSE